jgi:dephospho-CoA kinase
MLIVGLTGGVASGKSVISQILKEEGATLIDADQIARDLVEPHTPAWKELKKIFGEEILDPDGFIHRKKLAAKVFSDPEQRSLLTQILHPRIKEEMDRRVKEIGQKDPEAMIVIDAALLVELGEYRKMDKLIVVASTENQQIERLGTRDGLGKEEAKKIISSQVSLEEKLKLADFVIWNQGSLEETRRETKKIFEELKRIAMETKDKMLGV